MTWSSITVNLRSRKKRLVHETILEAARKLIRRDQDLSFSMKELADVAGISFMTVYNYFGSKDGVSKALFDRVIQETLDSLHSVEDQPFTERLFVFADAAVKDVLKEAVVYRAVCSAMTIVTKDQPLTPIFEQTGDLWLAAISGGKSWCRPEVAHISLEFISKQLAIAYRGVFSLWLCQEISDEEFLWRVEAGVGMAVYAFATDAIRSELMARITTAHANIASASKAVIVNKLGA